MVLLPGRGLLQPLAFISNQYSGPSLLVSIRLISDKRNLLYKKYRQQLTATRPELVVQAMIQDMPADICDKDNSLFSSQKNFYHIKCLDTCMKY